MEAQRRGRFCLAWIWMIFHLCSPTRAAALNHEPPRTLRVPAEFCTIQAAVDAAADGDTVLVAPGTYFEMIDMVDLSIVLRSEVGAEETVIDAQGRGTVLSAWGEGELVVDGFSVTGGYGPAEWPVSALHAAEGRVSTVRDCCFYGNSLLEASGVVSLEGGGVWERNVARDNGPREPRLSAHRTVLFISNGAYRITDSAFEDNWCDVVIGIRDAPLGEIVGNRIVRNEEKLAGGLGVDARQVPLKIYDNLFCSNHSWAINLDECAAEIVGNVICHNGGGITTRFGTVCEIVSNTLIDAGYAIDINFSAADIRNNLIYRHLYGIRWSPYEGSIARLLNNNFYEGQIADYYYGIQKDDPKDLHLAPHFVDAENHDYRLLPTSPLIDQGAGTEVSRARGPAPDVGAFEYHYDEPPSATVALQLSSRHLTPGARVGYTLTLTGTGDRVQRDAWIEVTGSRTHQIVAVTRNISIAAGETRNIQGSIRVPMGAAADNYRVKARWGEEGKSIEASAFVDVRLRRTGPPPPPERWPRSLSNCPGSDKAKRASAGGACR